MLWEEHYLTIKEFDHSNRTSHPYHKIELPFCSNLSKFTLTNAHEDVMKLYGGDRYASAPFGWKFTESCMNVFTLAWKSTTFAICGFNTLLTVAIYFRYFEILKVEVLFIYFVHDSNNYVHANIDWLHAQFLTWRGRLHAGWNQCHKSILMPPASLVSHKPTHERLHP